jgi:GxxExxY protein
MTPVQDMRCTAESTETAEKYSSGTLNVVTQKIIGAAIRVHQALGPGLLESAYEACLAFELAEMGLRVAQQQPLPVIYRDVRLSCGYRIDLVIDDCVIVEVKSVSHITPIHEAQLISYLKLSGRKVGLLINFNVKVLKDGLRRRVNNFPQTSANSATSAVNSAA